MAPPALGAEIFSYGFRLRPSPEEAVTYYLPRLIAGKPLHDSVRPVIHHADVYTSSPADLARQFCPLPRTGDRFFFTPSASRRRACAGGQASRAGSWYAQTTVEIMRPAGDGAAETKIGELKKLRYKKSGGGYTDWLMEEYSCCGCGCGSDVAGGGDGQFVLCKMYVSPRAAPTSPAYQESAAYFLTLLSPPPPAASVAVARHPSPAPAPKRPAPPQLAMSPPSAACVAVARRPSPAPAPKRPAPPQPAMSPPPAACVAVARHPSPAPAPKRPAPPQHAMSPPCAKRMRPGPVLQPAGGNVSLPSPPPPQPPSCAPPVLPTRPPVAAVRKMAIAPPQPSRAPPVPARPPLAAVRKMASAPPQPPSCAPRRSSTTRLATQPSPASAPPLAPPVPVRPAVQPHRPPVPLPTPPPPQQVRLPAPPVPVVRACQVAAESKQKRIPDPFEAAAMLRDEAEDQTVAAAAPHPPPPAPAATPALQDGDDLIKDVEEAAASPLPPPSMESPAAAAAAAAAAALQDKDDWEEFAKRLDAMEKLEAETAGGSTMTDDEYLFPCWR